jgi:FAD/FMN-containing dehydrogenase
MSVSEAIDALKAISESLVVLPGSEEYEKVNGSYLSTFESQLKPAAFALPSTTQDVTAILKALTPFEDKVPVAICGAGQQPAAGVANVANGITIHMQRFKGVKLSQDRSFVSIAPGETWGNVYKTLEPEGLSASGGRASTGGIGGLATHGTYPSILNVY